ncbi:hypothetical protein [Streptomyces olivochromogenes]|uniref:hypothetical protein n=1 Tax=Streptomyces olivochromogenes TaxID=1963 RepID=UPI0036913783
MFIFYDELDNRSGHPNGSIRDAVQPVGGPDEADLVACLDVGHILIDATEAGRDVIPEAPTATLRDALHW